MEDLIIRKATLQDLKVVQCLSQELIEYEYYEFDNKFLNLEWSMSIDAKNSFTNLIKNQLVYVAEYNKEVIGYISGQILKKLPWHSVQFAQLLNLYIKKDYRNKGIGTQLINKFIYCCNKNNINNIEVCALCKNLDAIKFYISKGCNLYTCKLIYSKD